MSSPGDASSPADYRVTVQVSRFEATPGEVVWFKALWTVLKSDGRHVAVRGESNIAEPLQGRDHAAVVAAMSRAVDRLGTDIAQAMRPLLARADARPALPSARDVPPPPSLPVSPKRTTDPATPVPWRLAQPSQDLKVRMNALP